MNKKYKFTDKINRIVNKITGRNKEFSMLTRISLTVIFTLAFALLFAFSFSMLLNSKEGKHVTYEEVGSFNYKVYLKENKFYEEDYLGENMLYVANLIKNINLDLNYNLKLTEEFDYDLNYDVIGKLIISNSEGTKTIFEKDYKLLENKKAKGKDKKYELKENLIIDYDKYNKLATEFKNTYGVDSVSNLKIYFNINKNIECDEQPLDTASSEMSITIPLTEKAIDVQIDNTGINQNKTFTINPKVTKETLIGIILSLISFIYLTGFIIEMLELIFSLKPELNEYDKFVNKILKEYDRLIAESSTYMDFVNYNITEVTEFEELLDVRDNLKLPIIYQVVRPHSECNFYIKFSKNIYLFKVKQSDFEEKEENIYEERN